MDFSMLQIQSIGFGVVEQTLEAKDSRKEKKMLLWRIALDNLPTKSRLKERKKVEEEHCALCMMMKENSIH
jgi:hypothetical protein